MFALLFCLFSLDVDKLNSGLLFPLAVYFHRLDVDKLDYLKRDNASCGELTTSEFSSLYENMKAGPLLPLPGALRCATTSWHQPGRLPGSCVRPEWLAAAVFFRAANPPICLLMLPCSSCRQPPQVIDGQVCFRSSVRSAVQASSLPSLVLAAHMLPCACG